MEKKIKKPTATYPLTVKNKRALALIEYAKKSDLVIDEADLLEKINCGRTVIYAIRDGRQSFTDEHITRLCLITGGNMNWVYDIEAQQFRDKGRKKSAMQLLREATAAVEMELAKKKIPQRPEILN